jgi:hypothetical protein
MGWLEGLVDGEEGEGGEVGLIAAVLCSYL